MSVTLVMLSSIGGGKVIKRQNLTFFVRGYQLSKHRVVFIVQDSSTDWLGTVCN